MKNGIALLTIFMGFALTSCGGDTTPTAETITPGIVSPAPAKGPDETAALETLREISEAQATYFKLNRRYALTFDELTEARLLNG